MPLERHRRAPALRIVESPPSADHDLRQHPDKFHGNATGPNDADWSSLMARAQSGDSEAYRRLLAQVVPQLRSLAIRSCRDPSDAEDAVQDTLLTIHAIRHTYDPGRPFGPWLLAVAHRRIVDGFRRRGRIRETAIQPGYETFPAPPTNIDGARCDRHALRNAIEGLPPAQRRAIRLLKLQEISLKEAAAASGLSTASLKVAAHRALKNLRRILAGGSEDA